MKKSLKFSQMYQSNLLGYHITGREGRGKSIHLSNFILTTYRPKSLLTFQVGQCVTYISYKFWLRVQKDCKYQYQFYICRPYTLCLYVYLSGFLLKGKSKIFLAAI